MEIISPFFDFHISARQGRAWEGGEEHRGTHPSLQAIACWTFLRKLGCAET